VTPCPPQVRARPVALHPFELGKHAPDGTRFGGNLDPLYGPTRARTRADVCVRDFEVREVQCVGPLLHPVATPRTDVESGLQLGGNQLPVQPDQDESSPSRTRRWLLGHRRLVHHRLPFRGLQQCSGMGALGLR
jgi:hypothetical protein